MNRQRLASCIIASSLTGVLGMGCAERQIPPAQPAATQSAGTVAAPPATAAASPGAASSIAAQVTPVPTPARLSPPIDEHAVSSATGVEKVDKSSDGTAKVSFPRKDVDVTVDGWKMPPFMGLTSWAAFSPGKAEVAEAMVMGDLVLFEDEVNPVMSVLFENGVDVTALHNHFFFDAPKVYFMHIGGEGSVAALGKGVRLAMDKVAEIRKRTPKPSTRSSAPVLPAKSSVDGAAIDAALGVKGVASDGMFKATMGRQTNASCGCPVGKAMGVNTWAAFAGSNDNAVVDGDFAVSEPELGLVLKTLRAGGIDIVAIHHHMVGETPRILFLHYWGRGKAVDLATTVRKALDLTAWEGKTKSSDLRVGGESTLARVTLRTREAETRKGD
jgi:Domain of Unknown Function (DUF1259)